MKKILTLIAVLGLIGGCTAMSTLAVTQNNEKERGYISLSTSANTEVAPDVAEISFAVKTYDTKSIQKATAANKEISDKIYTILKGMINNAGGDFIKTSDFHASPIYTYNGNKRNLDKYEVSNRVTVHTKSLDKVGTMIDKSIEAGATNVDSLNFSVSNYESQCNSLIEIASKKANTRAQIATKAMGATLDGIKSMDISCSDNNNYHMPRMYMAKNMMADAAAGVAAEAAPTSISSGVIKVYANVNVSYFVK
ncbi:SIMPL domain-containing protein [bacterium]|nr:SIMPL domain-containing protein [bacterium]